MKNGLFASFSQDVQQRLMSAGQQINLPALTELYKAGHDLSYIYFLTAGMASIVVEMEGRVPVEAGMIGDEGIVGIPALLGSSVMKRHCFMQIAGSGFRVPLPVMQSCFDQDAAVRSVVLGFFSSQLLIAEQVTACNRLHAVTARLARWILTAADRVHSEQVNLTQEFLGQMLGTMRTSVALVAGDIQRTRAIEYSRGRVQILDRVALTRIACDCYPIIRNASLIAPALPDEIEAGTKNSLASVKPITLRL